MSSTVGKSREEDIEGVGRGLSGPLRGIVTMAIKEGSAEHSDRLAKEEAEIHSKGVMHTSLFPADSTAWQMEKQCIQSCSFHQPSTTISSFMAEAGMRCRTVTSISKPAVRPTLQPNSSLINNSLLEAIRKVINGDSIVATGETKSTAVGQNVRVHKVVPVKNVPVLVRMLPSNKIVVTQGSNNHIGSSTSRDVALESNVMCSSGTVKISRFLQRKSVTVDGYSASSPTTAVCNGTSSEVHPSNEETEFRYNKVIDNESSTWCTPLLQRKDLVLDASVTCNKLPASSRMIASKNENVVPPYRPIYDGAAGCKSRLICRKDVPLLQREDLAIGGVSVPKSTVGPSSKKMSVKNDNICMPSQPLLTGVAAKCKTTICPPLPVNDVPLLQRTDLAVDGLFPQKPLISTYSRKEDAEVMNHTLSDTSVKCRASVHHSVPLNDTALFQRKDKPFNVASAYQPVKHGYSSITAVKVNSVDVLNLSSKNGGATGKNKTVSSHLSSVALQKKYRTFNNVLNKPIIATYSRKLTAKKGCVVDNAVNDCSAQQCTATILDSVSHTLASENHNLPLKKVDCVRSCGSLPQPVVNSDKQKIVHEGKNSPTACSNTAKSGAAYKNLQKLIQSEDSYMLKNSTSVSTQMVATVSSVGKVRGDEEHRISIRRTAEREASATCDHQSNFRRNTCLSEENGGAGTQNGKQQLAVILNDVVKVENSPLGNCPSLEVACVPGSNLCLSSSHVNIQLLQDEAHVVDSDMIQQVVSTTIHNEDLMKGKSASISGLAPVGNANVICQAQCDSSFSMNPVKFQEEEGSEHESVVQPVTFQGNCKELKDEDALMNDSDNGRATSAQGSLHQSIPAMDIKVLSENSRIRSQSTLEQRSVALECRQEVNGDVNVSVSKFMTMEDEPTACSGPCQEKSHGNDGDCSNFQTSIVKNETELTASWQSIFLGKQAGQEYGITHKINGDNSGLADPELWEVKDRSESDVNNQPSPVEDSSEPAVPKQGNPTGQNYFGALEVNKHYSVPAASTGLWQVKQEIAEDSQTYQVAQAACNVSLQDGCVSVQAEQDYASVSEHYSVPHANAVLFCIKEEVVGNGLTYQPSSTQGGDQGTVIEDDHVVTIPFEKGSIVANQSVAWQSASSGDLFQQGKCAIPESAVRRDSLSPCKESTTSHSAARRGSDPVCKVVISVRPNLPASIRQCRPLPLEQQFDMVISPSNCSKEVAKTSDPMELSTMQVKESPKGCHKLASAVVKPARNVDNSVESLPGGTSVSSSCDPDMVLEGASTSKDASPSCFKRRKPVVNLSSLAKRRPSNVNSGIACGSSSIPLQRPSSSERLVGGLYADIIRETNVTSETLGNKARRDGGNGGGNCRQALVPTVGRLDKLSHSKFQTFSQFRAQQLPLRPRARWPTNAEAVGASVHCGLEPSESSVDPDWKTALPASPSTCNEEQHRVQWQPLSPFKRLDSLKIDSKGNVKVPWCDDLQLEAQSMKKVRRFDRVARPQDGPSQTMQDLIFRNPPSNPMRTTQVKPMIFMDDEGAVSPDESMEEVTPAPQVKLNEDGELIIDEKSLFVNIEEVARRRARCGKRNAEDSLAGVLSSECPRRRSKKWKDKETLKFYRALNAVGTDFSVMETLFLNRTRRELKLKFLKEDRVNRELIDRTLQNPGVVTTVDLEQELEAEKLEQEKEEERLLEKARLKDERKERKLTEKQQKMWNEKNEKLQHKIIFNGKRNYKKTRRKSQPPQPPRKLQPPRKVAMKRRRAGTPGMSPRRRRTRQRTVPRADLEQLEAGVDLCKLLEESISSELSGGGEGQPVPPQVPTTPGSLLVLSAPSPTGRIYKVFMVNDRPHSGYSSES